MAVTEEEFSEWSRFRQDNGLRADAAWITCVAAEFGKPGVPQPYGLPLTSAEVAELDLRAQNSDAVAPIVDEYGGAHRAEYAGVYVDQRGVVIGLFTMDLPKHDAAIRKQISPLARFEAHPAKWSVAEIDKLRDRISGDEDWLRNQGAIVTSLSTDTPRNRVDVGLSVLAADSVPAIVAHYNAGDLLNIEITGEGGELLPKGSLVVVVVDLAGDPIPGLTLDLIPDVMGAWTGGPGANSLTDVDGAIRFPELGATGYSIEVRPFLADRILATGRVEVVGGEEVTLRIVAPRE